MDYLTEQLAQLVWEQLCDGLGGRPPETIADLDCLARRFGGELVFTPHRIATHNRAGFIVVRAVPPERAWRHAIHEIAESAMRWEGTEPCVIGQISLHEIARRVEKAPGGEGSF